MIWWRKIKAPLRHGWLGILALTGAVIGGVESPSSAIQTRFEHYTTNEGLSHSKVNCIIQDRRGFLWIATNEGFCRYDGIRFTVYRWKPLDMHGLSAPLVRTLYEDRQGCIWIGTENGGLDCLDPATERITHFAVDAHSISPFNARDVNCIIADEDATFWLATDQGLYNVDVTHHQAVQYPLVDSTHATTGAPSINVIIKARDQSLWLGTLSSGLWRFDRRTKKFTRYRHDPHNAESLGDNDIRSLYQDDQGRIWIGTNQGGLELYHPETDRFTRYTLDPTNSESTTIRALLADGDEHLLVGNRSGLYRFHIPTGRYLRFEHDPNDRYSLSHNSIQCLTRDACGDLWIGTRDGLNYLNEQNNSFIHYQARSNDERFLNNKVVYAILEDRRGDIWFGTEEGGINRLHAKSGRFTYYKHVAKNKQGLTVNNIKTLVEDRNGHIWVGTFRGGLHDMNTSSGQFRVFRHDPQNPHSLASNDIITTLLDRDGDLWIGTTDQSLDFYHPETNRFKHWLTDKGIYSFTLICALVQDRQGKIWLGSNFGRLGCLDKKTGQFKEYQLVEGQAAAVEVRAIHEDAEGHLWLGTLGSGLIFFDPHTGSKRSYTEQDGLSSNVVFGILPGGPDELWLSTTNGLNCFHTPSGRVTNYTRENGLQSNQFCYNAFLKSRDGKLYFGGINGVTAFYPQSVKKNTFIPPVVLTGLRVNNKPVEINGPDGLLKKSITHTDHLTLSYRHSFFSIEFAALNYAISSRNRYKYMMEGFDAQWNEIGNQHTASYTNLNPGDYTLRVMAANNDGVWNETGASLAITITPPIWKTWWAKVIGLLILMLIIKHLYNYQTQKKNFFQATSLANLAQLKLLRYQMNPHFLFNAHNSIRSMILIDKDRAWQMITEMSEFFRYTLLNFNKLEDSLDEEISAVQNYLHIEKIRYRDSLEVSFQIEDAARHCQVPSFLFQPLIENAIKYGMQTSPMPLQVNVMINIQGALLSIDVSNTGRLLVKEDDEDPEAHGNSLNNIKQRLEIMFKNKYEFRLYEEEGWVHAKIRIRYD
jgi:ligand-binding sensor domain-containing protein